MIRQPCTKGRVVCCLLLSANRTPPTLQKFLQWQQRTAWLLRTKQKNQPLGARGELVLPAGLVITCPKSLLSVREYTTVGPFRHPESGAGAWTHRYKRRGQHRHGQSVRGHSSSVPTRAIFSGYLQTCIYLLCSVGCFLSAGLAGWRKVEAHGKLAMRETRSTPAAPPQQPRP